MVATVSQQAQDNSTYSSARTIDSAQLRQAAQQLAVQAVWLYRCRAALWWLVCGLLATMGLVIGDYLLHVEEAGLRWLLSLTWLAALAVAGWRLFPPAWHFSLGPVHVARWIERSRPDLRGQLSNALAIAELPESDLRFGSASFRRAALHSAQRQPLDIDWASYLDRRPTAIAAAGVIALSLVAVGLAVVFPHVVSRGVARLVRPWQSLPWPHADELQFVNLPAMIASGSELPIEVIDNRPPLPADVELEVLATHPDQPDGPQRLVRMPMRVLDRIALATITDMRSDFSVRVAGGDDQDGAWHNVRVAELPELLEHQFDVSPPAYSRQPPTELVGERIEVLSGSKVVFHGRYSSRMQSIVAEPVVTTSAQSEDSSDLASTRSSLANGDDVNPTGPSHWPATLAADRQAFDLFVGADGGLVVESDRRWQLRLQTEDGLELTEPKTWSIHVVADRPPTVNLIPIEPSLATRESIVDIVGQATDDLELVEVRLVWQTGETAEPRSQTLWSAAERPNTAEPAADGTPNASSTTQGEAVAVHRQANIAHQWRPGEERLPLGQPVAVYLEARDSLGQVTRSVSQSLQIEDPQTVLAHLQAEEAKTFEPLRQLLNAQRRNEQAVKRTRDIVQETETVTPEQLDALASARQLQQSVAQQLSHSSTSILEKLEALGRQLARNALSDTELAEQIEQLSEEIKRLNAEAIEPALESIEDTQQAMRIALEPGASETQKAAAAAQLEKTAMNQEQATSQLSQLVDSIAAAETIASLQREFSDLERRQNDLRAETERFRVDRVANPESKTAEAARIGLRSDQLSLARAIDDLAATIDAQLRRADQTEEPSNTALENARQALIDQRVSQTMRNAAESIDAEQLSDGIKAQQAAAEAIARAATQFRGSGATTLESSSANLQALAQQLDNLAEQQSKLAQEMQEANASQRAPELAQQQTELAASTGKLSEKLEQQANQSLSSTVDEARGHAANAAEQASQSNLAQAASSAQRAAEKLREAQQNAQARAKALEKQLATQQLLDLGTAIDDLVRKQVPIVDKLTQLQQISAGQTERPAEWGAQVRRAAADQEGVRQQLLETSSSMQDLDTFAWLLDQCEIDMARAVAALEREQLEPGGLASATSALRKLEAAAQALVPPESGSEEEATQGNTENSGQEDNDASDAERRPSLASLKLLRALQNVINEETQALRAKGEDEQGPEILRLADEQQALAEQTQKLMQDILKE